MYAVEIASRAQKFLEGLKADVRRRVEERLKRLSTTPYPSDAKFIERDEGNKIFRYRIGDYRALYTVYERDKVVLVHKIDKRERVYQ
jgi:mRNA interferase RelE/StbE